MTAPLATIDDVEALWRPLTAEETTRVGRLLEVVSAQIRGKVADIDARIADGTLDPNLAVAAVVNVVVRTLTANPEGIRQESIGDYSVTYADGGQAPAVAVLDVDVAGLLPAGAPAGMVRLGRWS